MVHASKAKLSSHFPASNTNIQLVTRPYWLFPIKCLLCATSQPHLESSSRQLLLLPSLFNSKKKPLNSQYNHTKFLFFKLPSTCPTSVNKNINGSLFSTILKQFLGQSSGSNLHYAQFKHSHSSQVNFLTTTLWFWSCCRNTFPFHLSIFYPSFQYMWHSSSGILHKP